MSESAETTASSTEAPVAERALRFVKTILTNMEVDADATIAPDDGDGEDDEIRIEIEGPDESDAMDAIVELTGVADAANRGEKTAVGSG